MGIRSIELGDPGTFVPVELVAEAALRYSSSGDGGQRYQAVSNKKKK
jgi:hypothetical protein